MDTEKFGYLITKISILKDMLKTTSKEDKPKLKKIIDNLIDVDVYIKDTLADLYNEYDK